VLQYFAKVCISVLQYFAQVWCSVLPTSLQCNAHCNTQCNTQCNTAQHSEHTLQQVLPSSLQMSCSVLQCAGREIKLILQRQTQRARPRFSPICCTTAATIHDLMCLLQRVVVYCSFPPTCCAAAATIHTLLCQ